MTSTSSRSSSSFVIANHTLLIYTTIYLLIDALRAWSYRSDTTTAGIILNIIFFQLSLVLVSNSILYFSAYMDEVDQTENESEKRADEHGRSSSLEGPLNFGSPNASTNGATTNGSTKAQIAVLPSSITITSSSTHKSRTLLEFLARGCELLRTEGGMAYFLNIVGSFGYCLSSLIGVILACGIGGRAEDRASMGLDVFNMTIFIIDGFLFWHLWWKEAEEEETKTVWKKVTHVYNLANACNTFSSIMYLAFVAWGLNERLRLADQLYAARLRGDMDYYNREMVNVVFKERVMYFVGDIIYLFYAILLEVAWYQRVDRGVMSLTGMEGKSIQLSEMREEENGNGGGSVHPSESTTGEDSKPEESIERSLEEARSDD